jgi:ABC-type transport system substrate-binding protein
MLLPAIILLSLCISPLLGPATEAANPDPFFYVDVLAPNTNPARNQWATLMTEQLPKIGIGVDTFDHTGWAQISPRTWGHPGPYPIPTYDEGGFDFFFVGWSASIDYDVQGLYDTAGIVPDGNNHYQYSDPDMDEAIENYASAFVVSERMEYAAEIQEYLYRDVPSSVIIYPRSVFPMQEDLTGMDGLLWSSNYQPMELWSQGSDTELHYACPADFEDFHVHFYESVYDAQWLRQIYNGLVERQNGTRVWGGRLATSFDSADGLTYTVEIDPAAKWADGTDVTPDDIIFNYDLLVNDDYGAPDAGYYKDYWSEGAVEEVDDDTVTITFDQSYVFQDSNLAVDLIPKHIWESVDVSEHQQQAVTWAGSDPSKMIGIGPYKLEEWDAGNKVIHLTKNEYFGDMANCPEPNFDDVYFEFYSNKEGALSALASGDVDIVDSQFSPQLDELDIPGTYYRLVADPAFQEISYNCLHPRLGTGEANPGGEGTGVYIRRAIDTLIPRDTIVEEICDGLAAPGVTAWPDVALGYDDTLEPREYSVEDAKDWMREAGYEFPDDTTTETGVGLAVFMSILALAGATQVILLKKRK